jgi:hypothetical protein
MLWTKEQLPFHIRSKPEHILKAGLLVANAALAKGLSEDEATFVCLQKIKSLESQLKPKVEPRVVPSHIAQLLKQNVLSKESPKSIQQAFLGENALVPDEDRNLVKADFNSSNELVLTFNTGEKITTSAIKKEPDIVNVTTGFTTTTLSELKDTLIDSPEEGEFLRYDATTSLWKNKKGVTMEDVIIYNLVFTDNG